MYQTQDQLNCRCCCRWLGEENSICDDCLDAINYSGDRVASVSDEDGRKRNKPRRGKAGKDW